MFAPEHDIFEPVDYQGETHLILGDVLADEPQLLEPTSERAVQVFIRISTKACANGFPLGKMLMIV